MKGRGRKSREGRDDIVELARANGEVGPAGRSSLDYFALTYGFNDAATALKQHVAAFKEEPIKAFEKHEFRYAPLLIIAEISQAIVLCLSSCNPYQSSTYLFEL